MKKLLPFLLLFILAMLIWDASFDPYHLSVHLDDGDFGNFGDPAGTLVGALLAGGGIIVGLIALVLVAIVLAVVFAGVGIAACVAVVLAAVVAALALSPLLLPLLAIAIIWHLASRNRQRQQASKEHAV